MTDWVGQSAKYIVLGIAVLSVLFIESPLPVYYVVGGVCNAFLSKILKHVIKQPRPLGSLKGGYGMPSSHSQSIFYFLAVLAIKSCDFIHDTNLWRVFVVSLTLYAYFAW
jgi:dolichyldiphosphatase